MKVIKAELIGKGRRFGIVVSRFNEFITSRLLDGAVDGLVRHGVVESDIEVVWVPGAFEISVVAQKMAKSKRYDAVICLGTIIRGATPHFEYVASEVAKGIARISLETDTPCIFGVITADTLEQAIERAGTKAGNKGRHSALSALELANLSKLIV